MEPSPSPWISALRHSHDRLRTSVKPLGLAELERRSYASEWSIAQVLSHLGSQAEIFGLFLEAGLTGQEPPAREEFVPIWESWNAKDPQAQAADALRADQATLERFESLDADEQARLHLKMFGEPERQFILETGEAVTLTPADGETTPELGLSELRLPAEAFVRLVYGRMDEAHTPPVESAGVELDELRQIFPGF
jgi:hypothetical protein